VKRSDLSNVRVPGTDLQGWRAIAVYVLALYILLFIALNDRKLQVNFILFKIQSNELVALIVIVALSFAAGFFIARSRQPAHHRTVSSRSLEPVPQAGTGVVVHEHKDEHPRPVDHEHEHEHADEHEQGPPVVDHGEGTPVQGPPKSP
jgi:uncharacterized integral membrane protein